MGVYTIVVKGMWSGCFVDCGAFGVLIMNQFVSLQVSEASEQIMQM